jgi:hypothetical protein
MQLKKSFLSIFITTEAFIETQDMHEQLLESIISKNAAEAWYWAEKITRRPR